MRPQAQPQLSPFDQVALSYLAHGPVVPVRMNDKRPVGPWKEDAALTSAADLIPYLGSNLNVALRLDNFLVVDVDGEEGARSLAKLEKRCGSLPRKVVQKSGGGGLHIFFALPDGMEPSRLKVKHSDFPKIDFKAGAGHILIMSPSVHPSRGIYEWERVNADLGDVPPVPNALVETLSKATGSQESDSGGGKEGERHSLLLEYAIRLFQQGWDLTGIREALWRFVASFHDPWTDDEADREISGVMSWLDEKDRGKLFPPSDTAYDVAMFLKPRLQGLIVRVENGEWLVKRGTVFQWARKDDLKSILIRAIKPAIESFEEWLRHLEDGEDRKAAKRKLEKLKKLSWVEKAVDTLAGEDDFNVSVDALDPAGVVNFLNGPFKLNGDPAPDAICTKQMGVEFDPAAMDSPLFDQFLAWALPRESGNTLLEAIAHGMRGYQNSQNLWLIEGGGENGKSVAMYVFAKILGDYAVTPDPSLLFDKNTKSGGANEDLFSLLGARMAVFSEGPEGEPLNPSRVKSISGGDSLSARRNYGHLIHFESKAELFLMTNHETNLNTDDGGLTRRMKRIVFRNTISEAERDPDLRDKLIREGAAIVNKLLSYVSKGEAVGIRVSDTIKRDTDALIDRQDIMGDFVAEKLVVGPEFWVKGSDLYRAYQAWCTSRSLKAKPQVQFYRNFEKKVGDAEAYKLGGAQAYKGVGLVC